MHKCYIQGVLISQGTQLKKRQRNRGSEDIAYSDRVHKTVISSCNPSELQCNELVKLLSYKIKANFVKVQKTFYEWGNKPDTLLAKALRDVRLKLYIPCIDSGNGKLVYTTQ